MFRTVDTSLYYQSKNQNQRYQDENKINFQHHQTTGEFLDGLYSNMFFPMITRPSRITCHTVTLIYNIFLNDFFDRSRSGLLISDISDHLPSSETLGQLVGTKEFSWAKVYCNRATSPWALTLTELVPEAFEFPAFGWPEKYFSGQSAKTTSRATLMPSYTKLFSSSIATVAWAVQWGISRRDFQNNSAKSSKSQT